MGYDKVAVEAAQDFARFWLAKGWTAQSVVEELNTDSFYNPFAAKIGNKVYVVGAGGHIVVLGSDYVYRALI